MEKPFLTRKEKFVEFAPVGCCKPALVGLEGAAGRKEGLFVGVVPSALC